MYSIKLLQELWIHEATKLQIFAKIKFSGIFPDLQYTAV